MSTSVNSQIKRTITLLVVMALNCSFAHSKIIYVDDDATGANDGTSWPNAYVYLQDALVDANTSEKPVEIKVAQGIYRPDQGSGSTVGDRQATFKLINNVILKGGFAGIGELDPDVRDVEVNETILSGDLNGDDVEVAELRDLYEEPTRTENCYYVVTGNGTDKTAVLDGLVIIGGNNNGNPYNDELERGGGVYNYSGSPTFINCTFSANSAQTGGGMCNWENSNPILTNCTFIRNYAFGGSGMWNQDNSNPILTSCKFIENQSDDAGGGGMVNEESNPTLTNCKFIGNRSVDGGWFGYGAGMRNLDSSPVLTDCTFIANGGGNVAAGMYNCSESGRCAPTLINCIFSQNEDSAIVNRGRPGDDCTLTLINCIFSENSADRGRGMCNVNAKPTLTNCILWDGGNEIWDQHDSDITITYSNIQGSFPGEGNIDADPLWVNLGYWHDNNTPGNSSDDYWVDGDYHLKSQAGRFDPITQTWIQDDINSPCIDTGDPNSYTAFEPSPNGNRINMGAYGGTVEASKSE